MATYAPDYRFAKRLRKISTLCLLSILFYGCKQYPGSSEKRGEIKRELAGMPLKNFVLQRVAAYREAALQDRFDEAERQLNLITRIKNNLPGAPLSLDIDALNRHLACCKKRYAEQQAREKELARERFLLEHGRPIMMLPLGVDESWLERVSNRERREWGEPRADRAESCLPNYDDGGGCSIL